METITLTLHTRNQRTRARAERVERRTQREKDVGRRELGSILQLL